MKRRFAVPLVFCLIVAEACVDPSISAPNGSQRPAPVIGTPLTRPAVSTDELLARIADSAPAFGGTYLDASGLQTVVLVGQGGELASLRAETDPALADAIREGMARPVRYVEGRYNFRRLKDWRDELDLRLFPRGLLSSDIDETTNRISLEFLPARLSPVAIRTTLRELGIPEDAVVLTPGERRRMDRGRHRYTENDLHALFAVPPAGVEIGFRFFDFPSGDPHDLPGCTLGMIARDANGVDWVATNSHCTRIQGTGWDGTYVFQPHASVDGVAILGVEGSDPPYLTNDDWVYCPEQQNCRNSDVAWFQMAYQSFPQHPVQFGYIARTEFAGDLALGHDQGSTIIDAQRPRFEIVLKAGQYDVQVGSIVYKVGQALGWTKHTVTQTCVNDGYHVDETNTNYWFMCTTRTSGLRFGGDSGAPYFMLVDCQNNYGNCVMFVGIHAFGNGNVAWFNPIHMIETEFGSLNLVSGNYVPPEPPPVWANILPHTQVQPYSNCTFYPTTSLGGSSHSYQWFVDGAPVGANQYQMIQAGENSFELIVDITNENNQHGYGVLFVTVSPNAPMCLDQ